MDSANFPRSHSTNGILHYVPPNLCAFEPAKKQLLPQSKNVLLWIGGMFDTLLSVEYPSRLVDTIPSSWGVVMASLGSAGKSWGVGSIAQDASDVAKLVGYLKAQRPGAKIVLMGHSTGCQDCMEYVIGSGCDKRPPVDGVILQAPVSDREALGEHADAQLLQEANRLAQEMCRDGRGADGLPHRLTKPVFGRIAITARRWLDIASPGPDHAGADDYFSSDLPDERLRGTFGKFPVSTPLCILHMGDDDGVPPHVDKEALVGKWASIVHASSGRVSTAASGIVAGASHNLNGNPLTVVDDLTKRVSTFLAEVDDGMSPEGVGSRI